MKGFFLVILALVFTVGCDDRGMQEAPSVQSIQDQKLITEAKTLFEKKSKGARGNFENNFRVSWDKAMVFNDKNGNRNVSAPLQGRLSQDVNPELLLNEYLLVSYDDKDRIIDEYILQVVTEKNKSNKLLEIVKNYDRNRIENFTGKLIMKQIDTEISEGKVFVEGKAAGKFFGNKKRRASKNAKMAGVQCWEVYLITYYSDGTTTEETLYYFCIDDEDYENSGESGSGGSSSGDPNPQECSLDLSDATSASEFESESFLTVGSLERTKLYAWKAVNGLTYSITSNEVGVHKRLISSAPWKWHSLTHSSVTLNGIAPGLTISPSTTYSNATLGEYYANMSIVVHVTYSLVCAGSPITAYRTFPTNMNFYVN